MDFSNSPKDPIASLKTILGLASGWALSHYCGILVWIPGISTLALFLLFTKTQFHPKKYAGAISVVGGYVVWLLATGFIARNWIEIGLDVLLLLASVIWLWFRPTSRVALFFGLLQFVNLALNLYEISSSGFGTLPHRALTVHCIWPILAISCLIMGYIASRQKIETAVSELT